MPLKPGKDPATISQNVAEFHTGGTYAKTKKKFGKSRADKQAVAVAMNSARRSKRAGKKFDGGDYSDLSYDTQ